MSSSWLSSTLYLLTFFRCTLLWVNVNLLAFGIFSVWSLALPVLCLTAVAFIFNTTVCIREHKAKKRSKQLGTSNPLQPVKLSVICIDFVFAAAYITVFVFFNLILGGVDLAGRYNAASDYGWSFLGSLAYIGTLVAAHYHLFFASVCLHSWRQRQRSTKAKQNTERRIGQDIRMNTRASAEPASTYVE